MMMCCENLMVYIYMFLRLCIITMLRFIVRHTLTHLRLLGLFKSHSLARPLSHFFSMIQSVVRYAAGAAVHIYFILHIDSHTIFNENESQNVQLEMRHFWTQCAQYLCSLLKHLFQPIEYRKIYSVFIEDISMLFLLSSNWMILFLQPLFIIWFQRSDQLYGFICKGGGLSLEIVYHFRFFNR